MRASEILSENQYGGVTVESGYQMAENLLNRFRGEVAGIFTPNESTTFGMLRALTDAGLAGKVRFVGFDTSDKLIQALEAGEIQGLVLQNPFKMGEVGARTIVSHSRGQSAPDRIDTGVAWPLPEPQRCSVAALLRPRWPKSWQSGRAGPSELPRVGVVAQDRERPVDLLGQHHAGQLVRQRHPR